MSIFKKLHEIQKAVSGLAPDSKGNSFKYVSGSKVLSEIKPIMARLGILLKQEVMSIENTRHDYKTKNGERSEVLSKLMMKFTWVDIETGEKDENFFGANGQNDWDKGVGSALTYGERYFLLKYFHIATDEDDIDNPDSKKPDPTQKEKPDPTQKEKPELKDGTTEFNKAVIFLKGDGTISKIRVKYNVTPACEQALINASTL